MLLNSRLLQDFVNVFTSYLNLIHKIVANGVISFFISGNILAIDLVVEFRERI